MDMKIVNSLTGTVLKVYVDRVTISVAYASGNGEHWDGDCRIYEGKEDITRFVFDTDFYYIDTFEDLNKVVKKVKVYSKRVAHEKRFNSVE